MSRRRLVPIFLALLLLAGAPPADATAARDAERRAAADALLAEKATWEQAIAIYRELLDADPEWSETRLQLARVLAWRGDYAESLDLYAQLAAAADPPPGLAVERAEVLSWAGRTEEAAVAFERLIESDPNDARAARGLARSHRWSGRRSSADRWYRRALELEDDREAREEHLAMRSELGGEITGAARAFFDSDDFSLYRTDTRLARDLDFDTRLFARSATYFVRHDREDGAVLFGEPEDTRGYEGRLGIERRLGARWKALLEAGGRHWEDADAVPLARALIEHAPRENVSLGLEVTHDDMLERSYSLESVLRNVRRTGAKASAWAQLTPSLEAYAEAGGGLLSDSNGDLFAGASFSWRPVERWDLRLALALDAGRYQEHSEYYYSPELDLGATLAVIGRVPIGAGVAFTFDVGGGGGLSRDLGLTETGPSYRAKAGFAYRRGGLALDLDFARSQSVRATAYTTHEVALRASWSF